MVLEHFGNIWKVDNFSDDGCLTKCPHSVQFLGWWVLEGGVNQLKCSFGLRLS